MSGEPSSGAAHVTTVSGALPVADLGQVLPLEHLIADFTTPRELRAWGQEPDAAGLLSIERLGEITVGGHVRDNLSRTDAALAASELRLFARAGGGTIVDATSIGLGRDPQVLARLARDSGVAIVMGSGWYHPAWAPEIRGRQAAELADEIVHDLVDGVHGVRAGVIGRLGALDPHIADQRALLVAAARACAATGAPVILELPEPDRLDAVLGLLAAEGAPADRIALVGAAALSTDADALLAAAASGVFLVFDRIGRLTSVYSRWDDQDVADALRLLAEHGHAGQVLLSPGITERADQQAYGGAGYPLLHGPYRAFLAPRGVDDTLWHTLTVDNPRRYLTGASA